METAYKAVIKPKEGTILTVAREMSKIARKLADGQMDLPAYLKSVIDYGNQTLAKTPEMLPVLKEAGVVDSGGQGLMVVLEGAYDALMGKEIDLNFAKPETTKQNVETVNDEDIKFGYCTEFIINLERALSGSQVEELRRFLTEIGDSIVLVPDPELVKVHVHTNDPGMAISKALTYGYLTNMKIDNMRVEHREKLIKDTKKLELEKEAEAKKPAPPKNPHTLHR